MSTNEDNFFAKEIVYKINGAQDIHIKKDIKYSNYSNEELTMDIYYLENAKPKKLKPAIIFVTGYPDSGFKRVTGYKLKEVGQYISWAKLMAASGFIGITYSNSNPALDINILLRYIFINHESLGVDRNKICIWACSGNTPNAWSVLNNELNNFIRCAVFCYGYMPDIIGSTITSDAANQFHFVNPVAHISTEDFICKKPILIVRAGLDQMPGLNTSIDHFILSALAHNFPLSFINVSNAPHAFDIVENDVYSQAAIKSILSFISINLEADI